MTETAIANDIGLRPPAEVMRLERMGAAFPTRLSFLRILLRRMARENWTFTRPRFDLDREGYGTAVYSVETPDRVYSLIAFSQYLDPGERTDRVIAEAWDATFVLFDGVPDETDINRLAKQAPLQEAGRYTQSELVLSRANKSVRMFENTVENLANGRQPERQLIIDIGYLMRTTAVYGNGKFGIADRRAYCERPELSAPFQAEMLTVYLIRCFTFDLVEHVAHGRNPDDFTPLADDLKRYLGIGNATGLGMAPFLVSHPTLIHNWFRARETALARVRSLPRIEADRKRRFETVLARAQAHIREWCVEDSVQMARIETLREEVTQLQQWISADHGEASKPWDTLYQRATSALSLEGQELLVSLMMEPYPDLVDDLAEALSSPGEPAVDPRMTVAELSQLIRAYFGWAFDYDFTQATTNRYVWYYSEEKLEPRRGEQRLEITSRQAMTIAVARDIQALSRALDEVEDEETLAIFLMHFPAFRHAAGRVQTAAQCAYSEIRGNLIGEECRPIDILRAKLAYFGASGFDPKSDLWTRITMYQGAPLADELTEEDNWCFPSLRMTVP